jgi:pimeloyl-ACP methyl ester carboxylesterase
MSAVSAGLPVPEGPGSVSGAPHLPDGFTGTFTSRYIDTGGLRQHVVTGGGGPPLLLVHGWPQTWYAWRLVMPGLARDFTVIAPDQRGTGLSGKPPGGYDTGTLAGDLVALMDALGHRRFAVAGHDTGMWIGYALAADHPDRVDRLAVAETPLPGVSPSPPLFANAHLNDALWHFAFNRLAEVNDQLVTGREEVYFGWQFATKAARPLPDYAVRHYVDTLAASPGALHASFAIYRAAADARAGHRRRAQSEGTGRGHDETRRRRRADPGHPRLRPPSPRRGPGGDAGRADRVPGPVPGRPGHRPRPQAAQHRGLAARCRDDASARA